MACCCLGRQVKQIRRLIDLYIFFFAALPQTNGSNIIKSILYRYLIDRANTKQDNSSQYNDCCETAYVKNV